jgi:hypothetical protein
MTRKISLVHINSFFIKNLYEGFFIFLPNYYIGVNIHPP